MRTRQNVVGQRGVSGKDESLDVMSVPFDAFKGRQGASAADRDKVPDNTTEDLVPNETYKRGRSCFIPAKVDCYGLNNIRVEKWMGW